MDTFFNFILSIVMREECDVRVDNHRRKRSINFVSRLQAFYSMTLNSVSAFCSSINLNKNNPFSKI